VAVDGGEEGLSHVVVLAVALPDDLDFVHVAAAEFAADLVPDLSLVELFLHRFVVDFSFFLFFLLLLEFVELVVLDSDVDGHEDQFIGEVPHALDA
jgi:hypothetical protein